MPSPEFQTLFSLTRGVKAKELPSDLRLSGDTLLHILGIRHDLGRVPVVVLGTKPNAWDGARPIDPCITVLFRSPSREELESWGQTECSLRTAELLTNDGDTLTPSGRSSTFAVIG